MDAINEHCGVERDARGVARLTVRDAGALNILGSAVMDGARAGFAALQNDRAIRAVVLSGAGDRAFIGGADIKEMGALAPDTAAAFITRLRDLCEAVRQFPAPVIARIHGWCLGGGLELAAACDLRVASSAAQFGMPEVRLGIPSVIHAALLPRLVGWGRARWLLLTGATIDAARAHEWGLVDAVAAPAELDAAVEETLGHILACDPAAIRAQKELLRRWEELPLADSIAVSIEAFREAFVSGAPQRLMRDFLAGKRSA